jgi:hypothetical protein
MDKFMKETIKSFVSGCLRRHSFPFITAACAFVIIIAVSCVPKFSGIVVEFVNIIMISAAVLIILYYVRLVTHAGRIYRYLKKGLIIIVISAVTLFLFLVAWYIFCFFPDDQSYLDKVASSVKYRGGHRETVAHDLIRSSGKLSFSSPLTDADRKILLSPDNESRDIYIDTDPYNKKESVGNCSYAAGRIFYFTYQKKSIAIKGNGIARYPIPRGTRRFLSFDVIVPPITPYNGSCTVNVYHRAGKRTLLASRLIRQERKPPVRPFRYSNPVKSILFYIKHPAKSTIIPETGWERIRADIPDEAGSIEIEFVDPSGKNYLFAGSPRIFKTEDSPKKGRIRIAYLLFDTLSKQHIDIYEYPDLFTLKEPGDAVRTLGYMRALTPNIDMYADRSCMFTRVYSVGQVTRASIVPLWTSKPYALERMPVFRNIVSKDNRDEFYAMNFPSIPDTLSIKGFFTKQISCNAQGHGVSGVGVDLGFDENYDYTLEASEHTENIIRIIEFLEENQNRDFLLYAHINVPHLPHWVPLNYYLSALWDTDFNHNLAVRRANIRYLDDCFGKIMKAFRALKLDEDTMVIITADHTSGVSPQIRGRNPGGRSAKSVYHESQDIASFYSRSVYTRPGSVNVYDSTMNVPWMTILPSREKMKPGFVSTVISALDIGPTFIDIASVPANAAFDGKSFKRLFYEPASRNGVHAPRIPLIGRFQSGILVDGRYKYWQNDPGIYKFRTGNGGKKYIMQQEYLFDLSNDPGETNNLALDMRNPVLLAAARKEFAKSYINYPDKNFLQFTPDDDKKAAQYRVLIQSTGTIIYPKKYGEGLSYTAQGPHAIKLDATVRGTPLFASFETDPPDASVTITIYRDGKLMPRGTIFSAVEDINVFDNPIRIVTNVDRYAARIPAKTGLEERRHPGGISYYRIPLNYWLELNTSEQDIKLSPGIKEVLRGWGYIQ